MDDAAPANAKGAPEPVSCALRGRVRPAPLWWGVAVRGKCRSGLGSELPLVDWRGLLVLRRRAAPRRVPPRLAGHFLVATRKSPKKRVSNLAYGTQCWIRPGRRASPVRLEHHAPGDRGRFSRGSAQQTVVTLGLRMQTVGCVDACGSARSPHAPTVPCRGVHVTALTGGHGRAMAMLRPAGDVRAEQASRPPRCRQALCWCRQVKKKRPLSNVLAQQNVGRPPGRDPARCRKSAKHQQDAQATKQPATGNRQPTAAQSRFQHPEPCLKPSAQLPAIPACRPAGAHRTAPASRLLPPRHRSSSPSPGAPSRGSPPDHG